MISGSPPVQILDVTGRLEVFSNVPECKDREDIPLLANLRVIPHGVKAAVEALQNADKAAWNLLFTPKAVLDDDGSSGDLKRFAQELFGCDSFICIDRIANNGLYIEGELSFRGMGQLPAGISTFLP